MSNREAERAKESKAKSDRAESNRKFQDVLTGVGRSKGCCDLCNYCVRTASGEHRPCKMGHEDAGPEKEICVDCSNPHYGPEK
jgi:hypothetical protein